MLSREIFKKISFTFSRKKATSIRKHKETRSTTSQSSIQVFKMSENSTLKFILTEYPNYLDYVPRAYWNLPILPKELALICALSFTLLMIIATSGNLLMILVYFRNKSLQTAGNKLVINLSFSSLFMHLKSWVPIVNGFYGGPVLGPFGCVTFGGFGTVAGLSEIWTITFMAMDRCRTIRSIKARRFSRKQTSTLVSFIWILAIVFAIMPILGINGYISEPHLLSCTFDAISKSPIHKAYLALLIIVAWMIPLTTIGICYTKIFIYTRETRKMLKKTATKKMLLQKAGQDKKTRRVTINTNNEEKQVELKLAMNLFNIILIWICAWTPAAIVAILQLFGYGEHVNHGLSIAALFSIKISSIINMFIYGLRLPKFRAHILQFLGIKKRNMESKNMCDYSIGLGMYFPMAYKDDDLNDHLEDKRLKKSWTENKQVINQTTSFIKVHSRPKKEQETIVTLENVRNSSEDKNNDQGNKNQVIVLNTECVNNKNLSLTFVKIGQIQNVTYNMWRFFQISGSHFQPRILHHYFLFEVFRILSRTEMGQSESQIRSNNQQPPRIENEKVNKNLRSIEHWSFDTPVSPYDTEDNTKSVTLEFDGETRSELLRTKMFKLKYNHNNINQTRKPVFV